MRLNSLIKNNLAPLQIYSLSFLLAYCSFFYELCFAQLLSSLLGGTYLQYAISIGLFTFSLGMGTLIYEKIKTKYSFQKIFVLIEFSIVLIIFISPWLMIVLSNKGFNFLLYSPLILIGILTGLELPLLINQNEKLFTKTLAIDYGGMILAAMSFPLIFFPMVGLLPSLYLISFLNLFSISLLLKKRALQMGSLFFIIVMIILIIVNADMLNNLSSHLLEIRHD